MAKLLPHLRQSLKVSCFAGRHRLHVAELHVTAPQQFLKRLPLVKSVFFNHYREKYDPDFTEESFLEGAAAQMSHISHRLAERDLDSVADLVWELELDRLRNRFNYVSDSNVEWLRFDVEHIVQKHVENVCRWHSKGQELGINIPVVVQGNNSGEREGQTNFLAVYVLYKKLSPDFDPESTWTVSILHHKRPSTFGFVL